MAEQKQIDYQKLGNKDVSEGLSAHNVHDHLKENSVEENYRIAQLDRKPFGVCVLNITGEFNIGTIIRNAHLTGARVVATIGRKKSDKRGEVGSSKYMNVERISGLNEDGLTIDPSVFWGWLNKNNFRPIFVEQGGTSLNNIYWPDHLQKIQPLFPCFVFGNENRGIQADILRDKRGMIVSLEQLGIVRSYNVASAAAIVLHNISSGMGWFK